MAECNRQTRTVNQEAVIINGSKFFGTFGDPQMIPEMIRQGYNDQIIYGFVAPRAQFASEPVAHQKLLRVVNNQEYFIQMVDFKDPVAFTFILVDREL